MINESTAGTTVIDLHSNEKPKATWRQWLIGRPLQTADAPKQTIGKAIGLAVFASDAFSSTAYATQEIMIILAVAAAAGGMRYVFPISIAIVILMVSLPFRMNKQFMLTLGVVVPILWLVITWGNCPLKPQGLLY